jgi:hypothetical protein
MAPRPATFPSSPSLHHGRTDPRADSRMEDSRRPASTAVRARLVLPTLTRARLDSTPSPPRAPRPTSATSPHPAPPTNRPDRAKSDAAVLLALYLHATRHASSPSRAPQFTNAQCVLRPESTPRPRPLLADDSHTSHGGRAHVVRRRVYSAAEIGTFRYEWVGKMPLHRLDTSMPIGFVCRREAESVDLRRCGLVQTTTRLGGTHLGLAFGGGRGCGRRRR